jgi:hypothetical protein
MPHCALLEFFVYAPYTAIEHPPNHVVYFLRLLPLSACVLTCETAPVPKTEDVAHLLANNTYILCAVDRSLPVDVHYLHLSWRGR